MSQINYYNCACCETRISDLLSKGLVSKYCERCKFAGGDGRAMIRRKLMESMAN